MHLRAAVPNVITYNALISACEKGGKPRQAHELFEAMRERGMVPNTISMGALILSC